MHVELIKAAQLLARFPYCCGFRLEVNLGTA
jgi:hypothetical protein